MAVRDGVVEAGRRGPAAGILARLRSRGRESRPSCESSLESELNVYSPERKDGSAGAPPPSSLSLSSLSFSFIWALNAWMLSTAPPRSWAGRTCSCSESRRRPNAPNAPLDGVARGELVSSSIQAGESPPSSIQEGPPFPRSRPRRSPARARSPPFAYPKRPLSLGFLQSEARSAPPALRARAISWKSASSRSSSPSPAARLLSRRPLKSLAPRRRSSPKPARCGAASRSRFRSFPNEVDLSNCIANASRSVFCHAFTRQCKMEGLGLTLRPSESRAPSLKPLGSLSLPPAPGRLLPAGLNVPLAEIWPKGFFPEGGNRLEDEWISAKRVARKVMVRKGCYLN